MAPPSKAKHANQQKDFAKRPKAKVGKRAPSKLNATDTSFKTASVAVRSQDLDKNSGIAKPSTNKDGKHTLAARMELASSRGNALTTLQTSLRHHASAVRCSGLKGIRDAVQSLAVVVDVAASSSGGGGEKEEDAEVKNLGVSILEANLPSLLPNMCRCWLDEDDDVRNLAVQLFGDILKNLSSSTQAPLSTATTEAASHLRCLVPFVPFLCAYTSSALNSLDRSIRKDGALIVGMLASSSANPSFGLLGKDEAGEGSGVSNIVSREVGKHVDLFLPSLERLLSSMSFGGKSGGAAGGGGDKKRKRDANHTPGSTTPSSSGRSGTGTAHSTLLSLAFLLKASLLADDSGGEGNSKMLASSTRRLDPSLYLSGECSFLQGASAHSNSLLLFREFQCNNSCISSMESILDLPTMTLDEDIELVRSYNFEGVKAEGSANRKTEDDTTHLEKVQQLTSIVEVLRMKFVELTHSGRKPNNDQNGLILPTSDLETLDVLVQALGFAHRRGRSFRELGDLQTQIQDHAKNIEISNKRQKKSTKKSTTENQHMGSSLAAYRTSIAKMLALLLENFSVRSLDGTSNQKGSTTASRFELTNAGICSALAELGGETVIGDGGIASSSSPPWVNAVFSYVLPRLDNDDEGSATTEGEKDASEGVVTNMLLKVVQKLLLPSGNGVSGTIYLLKNRTKRHELLEAFGNVFFPKMALPVNDKTDTQRSGLVYATSSSSESADRVGQIASSAAGRTAALLLTSLVSQFGDRLLDPLNKLHDKQSVLILQMASVLPTYLVSWKGNFSGETGRVLASLLAIVRQWSTSINAASKSGKDGTSVKMALIEFCLGLRCSIEMMFNGLADSSSKKKNKKKNAKTQTPSIFEELPEQVQKLLVGIVGLLQCPTDQLTASLSVICSKSFTAQVGAKDYTPISTNMANYIMEVIHSLRKTMSMSTYLMFLINSSGIENVAGIQVKLQKAGDNTNGDETPNNATDVLFLYDKSISQLSRFLISSCDNAYIKILPMIRPIMEKWVVAPTKVLSDNENSDTKISMTKDIAKGMVHARAALSIVAGLLWDAVFANDSVEESVTPDFVGTDEQFDSMLIDSIIDLIELSSRLLPTGGDQVDDLVQQQYLAKLLGPITLILRYRHGMLSLYLNSVSDHIADQSQSEVSSSSGRKSSSELHMKALMLVLKSKEPTSISSFVESNSTLQTTLLSVTDKIEKAVSNGHLSHLSEKLSHQAKLIVDRGSSSATTGDQ